MVLGPGDDAAAVRIGDATALATADILLEGVHFEIGLSTPADVGWKAMAVNVSDIAAMGGVPRFALVSLGAPATTAIRTLTRIYEGLDECARACGVAVVGGDTVRADGLIVSVAAIGEPGDAGIVTRGGARPGDLICVTGSVGGAAAGLALLHAAWNDERAALLLERYPKLAALHRRPTPRVREGLAAARAGATAMIDISDGLGVDLGHICKASKAGHSMELEQIPIADGVEATEAWAGVAPGSFVLSGGDDYELIIAIPPNRLDELHRALAPTPVTRIGEFTDGDVPLQGVVDRSLDPKGWDHFEEQA